MKINKFYVAYAVKKYAMPDSIFTICDTYEEAKCMANDFLYDNEVIPIIGAPKDHNDSRVWIHVDYIWYCVWGRDATTGCLIVSKDGINSQTKYVSDWR